LSQVVYRIEVETLFEELKRYVGWRVEHETALRALKPFAMPHLQRIADKFYDQILQHEEARRVLLGGESSVGHLKIRLTAWMERLLEGPWDEDYYELRCRIGRVHVRIALPQHYMFGAMNVLRDELKGVVESSYREDPERLLLTHRSLGKILDLELAIMLHTYREDMEAQQARKERLATFGQLIGSIGHELRNPLGVIESSMFIIEHRAGDDERVKKHIGRVGEQLHIANGIVSSLLDMIRDRPLVRESVKLGDLVESIRSALPIPPRVRVVVDGIGELPPLNLDQTHMRQALRNLIENGVQAVTPEGEVFVFGRVDQAAVEIAVEDTGPGVDPEVRRRLFEPLVTTKTNGIGLGLALVKRIVTRHGGEITYFPRDGGGSRFVVRLPV
jgi:two-component system sensor histidine kinase HydH